MTFFKNIKEGDCIYAIDNNGIVTLKWVKAKSENWYEHMCHFHFDIGSIYVNMDMHTWFEDDTPDLLYCADKDIALAHLREMAEKANNVTQNCLRSLDMFL